MSDLSSIINGMADDLREHNNSTTRRYQREWFNPKSNGWEVFGDSYETEAELLRHLDYKAMYYQTRIACYVKS